VSLSGLADDGGVGGDAGAEPADGARDRGADDGAGVGVELDDRAAAGGNVDEAVDLPPPEADAEDPVVGGAGPERRGGPGGGVDLREVVGLAVVGIVADGDGREDAEAIDGDDVAARADEPVDRRAVGADLRDRARGLVDLEDGALVAATRRSALFGFWMSTGTNESDVKFSAPS
jgi:hypothetical protein